MQNYKITLPAVRVNAGLTQEELARKMEVSRATIINWENGTTKINKASLTLFADICNFPVELIFLPYQFTK